MFPKIVPPACTSIIFFHKDRPECVSGIPQPLADEGCHSVPAGRQPGLGLPSLWRQGCWCLPGMSWTEDILRYLGSSSSWIKGIREDKWWAGGGRAGRNKESGEQSRRVQHKPSQPKTELSQNRRDKQTQGRRKGKGCKTKKQDLFQFLKDTMKTNPREARSDYCALSWLTRNVEYPVFFQTSAAPSTFKGKGV